VDVVHDEGEDDAHHGEGGLLPPSQLIEWRVADGEEIPTPKKREIVLRVRFFCGGVFYSSSLFYAWSVFYVLKSHNLN
jgi:hypothetical protein